MESGSVPDIAMPPLDQTPPIAQAAPDPWGGQTQQAQADNPFQVPDELPADTREVMNNMQTRDDMSSIEEPQESIQEAQQETQARPHEEARHPNFKALRDQKERAEIERDLALRKMYEMEQYYQQQAQQKQPEQPQQDYEVEVDDDALIEGKTLKKVNAKIRKLEQKLQESQQINNSSIAEARIRSSFPDIDQVVSKDNIDILNQYYPEIAKSLRYTPDLYEQAAAAYSAIKNLGIYKDQKVTQTPKAVVNTNKPRSLASVSPQQGDSPLSRANAFANGLTDEVKQQLRKEMFNARRSM